MRLVHISDPHFGTEIASVVSALQRQVESLNPDVLLLSGDITQRARTRQFRAASRFFAGLPARHRLAIPGNHDIPLINLAARAFRPYAGYERAFGAREQVWRSNGVVILALDATHPTRWKDGHLPSEALERRLRSVRAAAGESGLLLVAAHQPLYTEWREDSGQTLIDRDESARLFAQFRIDVIFSGHVHVPLIKSTAAVFPDLGWSFILSGAGTAVSRRTRAHAPNSFNVLDVVTGDPPNITICRHDFLKGSFCETERHEFRRSANGW